VRFKRSGDGVTAKADELEVLVLHRCCEDLLRLLGEDEPEDADPLAALVGLSGRTPETPTDPALARLLPDAYGDDDPAASADFRRYTDADLRAGKRAALRAVRDALPVGGGKVRLSRDEADAWLGALNDLRLVLGTRLEVTEDLDADDLAEDDPRLPGLEIYGWLGWLQESLLGCLDPRP
jgi:hypothetical protein